MSVAIWVGYPRSWTAGRARPPQFVTLHYTAGSEGPTSAESGAQYDKTRTDGTSTGYFVDSLGPALQEVPDADRSHTAFFHGNEIGIHIEICGTRQTRAQWLDPVSLATLKTAAALTREICDRHEFELRRLSVAETRAAYYGKDHRPTGINDHGTITLAFPEDGGDHDDVGADFPWDVFMEMVRGGQQEEDGMNLITIVKDLRPGPDQNTFWACDGMFARGPLTRPAGHPPDQAGPIGRDEIKDLKNLAAEGVLKLWNNGDIWPGGLTEAFGQKIPWPGASGGLVPHTHDVPAASTGPAEPTV